ncbi:DoxX family protein [Flavisolibacter ginsenosidimutans]|uniref:DoxX family protein n=1 Tax=Flavisolibacter ginsenosidimutans TaxID=661481 RepID=A0A5B8UK42_9BACT|nr:DoxX family protein [Flavisolibacter ginsenosidimutans]QEC57044.1 DoxX family protein [Flavisolibacter ginsenosidimutans]
MKSLFKTNENNWSALIARLALAFVVFPHGAQKLFGWFGGSGFQGTMTYMTTQGGLPFIIALLVILIESIAALMVLFGFATRIAALGIFGLFTIIAVQYHAANGFFMNWFGNQKGEGIEYFIILLGLALALIVSGGGKASADAALVPVKNRQ